MLLCRKQIMCPLISSQFPDHRKTSRSYMLLMPYENPSWLCSFPCSKETALKDKIIWAGLVVGRLIQLNAIGNSNWPDQMRANSRALITFHQRGERGERRRKRTRRSWRRRTLTQRGLRTWRTRTIPQAMDTSGPSAASSSWTPGSRSLKQADKQYSWIKKGSHEKRKWSQICWCFPNFYPHTQIFTTH